MATAKNKRAQYRVTIALEAECMAGYVLLQALGLVGEIDATVCSIESRFTGRASVLSLVVVDTDDVRALDLQMQRMTNAEHLQRMLRVYERRPGRSVQ